MHANDVVKTRCHRFTRLMLLLWIGLGRDVHKKLRPTELDWTRSLCAAAFARWPWQCGGGSSSCSRTTSKCQGQYCSHWGASQSCSLKLAYHAAMALMLAFWRFLRRLSFCCSLFSSQWDFRHFPRIQGFVLRKRLLTLRILQGWPLPVVSRAITPIAAW